MAATAVSQAINQASGSLRNRAGHNNGDKTNNPKELQKQDFLNLMMIQMANQDPFDPMKSDQMMQQMAALGTVEQLQNLNAKFDKMLIGQNDLVRSNAYSFLGKDIEIGSRSLEMMGGVTAPASYTLGGDADKVIVYIVNETGDAVRVIRMENQVQGNHNFAWDGTDNDGDLLADGTYSYKVLANTEDGEKINVEQLKRGLVSNISFENGRPFALINGEQVPLSEVKGVNNRSETKFGNYIPLPLKKEIQLKAPIIKPSPLVNQ